MLWSNGWMDQDMPLQIKSNQIYLQATHNMKEKKMKNQK